MRTGSAAIAAPEGGRQQGVGVADRPVAAAGRGLEPGPVADLDPAAPVVDQARPLQAAGGLGHGRALQAEHQRQELLRQEQLGAVAGPVLAITNDDRLDRDPRLTTIRDPEPHAGVLPALLAALDAATTPLAVLVACDMPFLDPGLLRHLVGLAADCDVVMPVVDGRPEPMHAVYRVGPCRDAIQAALARNERRMISFLDHVRTRRVDEAELRQHDPELWSFFNVNPPDDLEAARRLAAARSR
jgi:molybdopterin-guanine dinucleotide biosynthesis protein A